MTLQHVAAGNASQAQVEFLVIRGFLGADLTFHPMASRSAFALRQPSNRAKGPYFAELRDDQGKPLNREAIDVFQPVVCFNHESNINIVNGRIALREGSSRLLLFKEDILIDERPVSAAPSLKLMWKEKSAERGKSYPLELDYSDPLPGAFLQVFYQWGERAYKSLGLLPPRKKITVKFAKLQGGKACRLFVAYTSGMRTRAAVTRSFSVPPAPGSGSS